MKTKKILTSLLLTLFVVTMSVSVFAANAVAEIDGTTYTSIYDAVSAATDGDVITLLDDIYTGNNAKDCIKIEGKSITLDLNGKLLSQKITDKGLSVAAIAIRSGAALTVKDSVGGGKISATKTAVQLTGTLNLESGTIACDVVPTAADTEASFAYPIWFYAPKATDAPAFNMTGGALELGEKQENFKDALSISFDNEYTTAANYTNAVVAISAGSVEGGFGAYETAEISVTGGSFTADISEYVPADYSTVTNSDGTVSVVSNNEAKIGSTPYATLADALAVGGEITLLKDVTSSSIITVAKDTVLDLNGFTVTGSAKKTFEVYANATFKNGKIKNVHTNKEGRCIDTRTGGITLALDDVSLFANTNGYNQQVINIGGDATGTGAITATITDSTITASNSGYGIMTFNPVDMTITNSEISGYAALYFKAASGSMGSQGSDVDVVNSELNGSYHANESFGAIVFEDTDIDVVVDADSSITTEGNAVCFSPFEGALSTENNSIALNGTVSANKVVEGWKADATVSSANASVITALENQGFVVTDGTIADKLGWTSATDAGYYMVDGTKTGLMRYLFHADITKDITEAGIMYVSTSIFDKDAPYTNQLGQISAGAPSADNAFYSDITGIPESAAGSTYYAVAYVKTADGTFWSDVVGCEPNFEKYFSSLDGGVK